MRTNYLRMLMQMGFLSGILLVFACSKEEKIEPDYTKVHLIKTEVIGNTNDSFTHTFGYEYDNDGKIVKKTWENDDRSDVYEYQYGSGSISIIHSSDIFPTDTAILELNNKGLVVCKYNLQDNKMTRYRYDDQGYCVYSRYYEYGADTSDIVQEIETTNFTYIEGNLLLEDRVYNGTTEGQVRNFYYDDKVNTIGNLNRGQGFFGKSSKNLTKVGVNLDEFDAENRLIKRTENDVVSSYEFY